MTPDAPTTTVAGYGNGRRLEEGRPPNPQSGGFSAVILPRPVSAGRDIKSMASAGGKARAAKLTPERRREIARMAGAARWAKHPPGAGRVRRRQSRWVISDVETACSIPTFSVTAVLTGGSA
jgi:hypothetical protein